MVVGIAGLGVIGGSIGLGLQERGLASTVVGYDVDPEAAKEAQECGCVQRLAPGLEELGSCDVVFVAAPPFAVRTILDRLEACRLDGTVVTDCASTKTKIVDWARTKPIRQTWFLGGHPIAGGEGSGPRGADASAFEGATWVLTPPATAVAGPIDVVESLIRGLGAQPLHMNAEDHDKHVAVLSHLPHALAGALVLAASGLERPGIGGGSWRDLTRVAGSNPALWRQILLQNRDAVLAALDLFDAGLAELRSALVHNDGDAIRAFFEDAKQAKRKQGERR